MLESTSTNAPSSFAANNLDLLRLLAALQVAFQHFANQLNLELPVWTSFLMTLFPGVPVFFFISGFLISKSWEKTPHLPFYAKNRCLRLYPGLLACTTASLLAVYLSGYVPNKPIPLNGYIAWLVGQLTFVQFYNPDYMRSYGTGVLNGSLWTISVELQLYVLVPIIYRVFNFFDKRASATTLLIAISIPSVACHYAISNLSTETSETFLAKITGVSFLPWLYMFAFGMLCQKNFHFLHSILRHKTVFALTLYIAFWFFSLMYLSPRTGNKMSAIQFYLLAITIFALAYGLPSRLSRQLKNFDLSYGIYIYHAIFVNLFLYLNAPKSYSTLAAGMGLSILLAIVSWFFVEKPYLRLKTAPLRPIS